MPEDLATQQLKQALVDNNIDINVVTNKEIKDALKQISISSNEATKQYNQINGFVESDKLTQEEIDEANRQYNEVVAKYKDTELWLKAPNGEPTNLTEQQSVQVRTLNFKKWFGDWEKAKIRERLEGQKPVLVEAKYHIEEPKE